MRSKENQLFASFVLSEPLLNPFHDHPVSAFVTQDFYSSVGCDLSIIHLVYSSPRAVHSEGVNKMTPHIIKAAVCLCMLQFGSYRCVCVQAHM